MPRPARRPSHREQLDAAVSTALVRVGPSALALADAPAAEDLRKQQPLTPRLGATGQNYAQGVLEPDWNPELSSWDTRTEKLEELRLGDAVVAAILERWRAAGLRATWTVEAGDDLPELPSALAAKGEGDAAAEDLGAADRRALAALVLQANLLGIGPAEYRMRTTWAQFFTEASTAEAFGVAFFEKTMRLQDGPWGTFQVLDGLYWMHPRSITKLMIDRNGNLLGVLQEWKASFYDGTPDENAIPQEETVRKVIPASDLVVHVCNLEGSNYLGNPRIRPMWMDAKRRNFLSQAQVVDAQKRAVGIPYVKLGALSQGEAKEFAITQAKRLREGGNELSYVVMMEGDEVGFLDMKANVPDLSEVIRAQEARMRGLAGQEQFQLGQEGTGGSRAVASVNSEYYDLLLECIVEGKRSDAQRQIVEPLAVINFPDVPTPQLRVANLTPPNIGPVIQLASSGGIKFRGEDEQHFRKVYKLPLLSAAEIAQRNEAAEAARQQLLAIPAPGADGADTGDGADPKAKGDGPAKGRPPAKPPTKPGKPGPPVPPPKPAAQVQAADAAPRRLAGYAERGAVVEGIARRLWREPTAHERQFLRLADIERSFEDFQRDFVQQVRSLREAAILEGLRKTRVSQKRAIVGRLRSSPFTDVITELARRMREFGRRTAWGEIAGQVQAFNRADAVQLEDDDRTDEERVADALAAHVASDRAKARAVESAADVAAELQQEADVRVQFDVQKILDDIVAGIERQMLGALEEGMTEEQAKDATRRALLGKSDFDLNAMARGEASKNFNDGRAEVAAQVRETLAKSPESGLALNTVVRSEILDDATCDTCASLDGKVIEIDSDDYWEWMPPNKCEGGSRCRGFYVLVVERGELQEAA